MPQNQNYTLQTGQKDAYGNMDELVHNISFRPTRSQLNYIQEKSNGKTGRKSDRADIIRELLQLGIREKQRRQKRCEDHKDSDKPNETLWKQCTDCSAARTEHDAVEMLA